MKNGVVSGAGLIAPPIVIEQVSPAAFHQEARAVATEINGHKDTARKLGARLVALERAARNIPGVAFENFQDWMVTKNQADRDHLRYCYAIGVAVTHGFEVEKVTSSKGQERTPNNTELLEAGRLMLREAEGGPVTPADADKARDALRTGELSRQKPRADGTVKLVITVDGAREADTALEKFNRCYVQASATGEVLEKAESLEYILRSWLSVDDENVIAWLKGQGLK